MTLDLPTVLFQAVNFLVLVVVLWRLLWRPLRRHMSARAQRIEEGLGTVERGREEVQRLEAEVQAALTRARTTEREVVARAEQEGAARRAELLEEATRAAVAERDRIVAQIDVERRRRDRESLLSLAPTVAALIGRILTEVGDTARLHEGACERFAEELSALGPANRERIRNAGTRDGVELSLARPGVPSVLRESLAALLPDGHAPRTRTDPDLLAGASLRAGELVFDGSMRAQVERALGEGSP